LLIFDEVMSGFRASLRGASGLVGVEADIITFGKVIGAGMPVGAFASRAEIMDRLSPDGDIYQAGTLSGNPVAMAAGLTSLLKLKNNPKIYDELEQKAIKLTTGLKIGAKANGIDLQVDVRGSMFGFFFSDKECKNIEDVNGCDFDRFATFHQKMLNRGFYFACSQYETGFISTTISDKMIDDTIKNATEVFKEIR
jgi:glutamate-1-semialdehyde 2,1-aminomutase